jgi:hypothetical protein
MYSSANGRDFKNSKSLIASGIDTKTEVGYVMIPTGNDVYRWEVGPEAEMLPAPSWTEIAVWHRTDGIGGDAAGGEARAYQGKTVYGDWVLAPPRQASITSPSPKLGHRASLCSARAPAPSVTTTAGIWSMRCAKNFDLPGMPILLTLREKANPYAGRKR